MACKLDIKKSITDKVVELSKTNSRESVNEMFGTEVIKASGRVFIPSTLVEQYWAQLNSYVPNKLTDAEIREIFYKNNRGNLFPDLESLRLHPARLKGFGISPEKASLAFLRSIIRTANDFPDELRGNIDDVIELASEAIDKVVDGDYAKATQLGERALSMIHDAYSRMAIDLTIDNIANNRVNLSPTPTDNRLSKNDKIIFGHPGIGKTYLKESGRTDVIDFDSDYKVKINKKFNLPEGFKARNDFQKNNKEEYQEAVRELWNEAKQEAKKTRKQLFASDMILLREFSNDFDKVITMSKDTFINRAKQRDDYTEGETESWKSNLDAAISKVPDSKIITTDKYLSELLPVQNNVSLSPTPIAPRIDNLQAATEAEISRLRQENSRLKQAANNINPDSVDADSQLAELFRRQQNLQNRIDTLTYRNEAYKNYDFDMLEDIFNTDLARLQYLMEDTLDLQEKLRNIKEAQRIIDYYSEIGDFSREENFLFDDTASVPDGIRLFFQNFANTVEPYNARIAEIQKKIIVDLTKSVPTIEKWLEDKQIELSYEFLTKPVKDKDWLSMQLLSSEDNYASDQILIIDVLMTMAREYEDAAIKQRRDIIEQLDAKIKAIIGKHNNYDIFKQLDENGEFTGDIIMPFAQKYFNARKVAKSAKYAKLRELRQKPSLSAAEVKLAKKLSKEIKQWELENELMLDPRKLPEIKDAFPDLVREFDVNISDADRAAYKANVITHLNQKGYDSYVGKVKQHIKEYRLLENYMQEWADDNLTEFVQSLNLKPGINVNNSVEAMRIWKALHSPFYALIDHNTVLPLTIEVDGQMRTLSEISNIKDSHYRFTEVVPRRNKGTVTNVNNVYNVQNTGIDTGFYDSRFAAIENDASLYDFWYFAIHNLSLAKQMMPYRFQQGYQINSILYMEKGVMEQITSDGAFNTVYSRAWDGLVKSLTDNDLSTESYSEDPFGGRERNINYNFLGTRQQLEDKLYEKKLIEYFVKNKINATSVQEARSKGLLTPTINKALADLRKEAKREIAEKASFDLGSVLKFYLGTMVALNHKENILPVLNNIEATIGTIRKAQTNRQGKTMTEKGALKATDLPIVNAIDRVAYQLDVYTGQPTQMIEGTSSKTMLNKEETEIVKNLEALKAEATEDQKVAIQKLIDSYGSKLTGSGTMDTVLAYLRFRGLGWNVSAQVANWSAGYFANFTAAADGRIVKASALQRAYNIFWHLVMPSFVKSKVNQETSNKIKNLMYKGDFLLDATSEMQKSRFKSDSTLASKLDWLSPYMPTRLTEYMNQGTLVVGRLMTVKVQKNDGTMATLFDALDENLNIKPEFSNIAEDYNWNTGELMAKETTLIRNLIQNVHGDYSEIGRQYAKRKIAGRMAMFFKTWLPNAMKVRFGAEKFDPVYNMETKGRYRSYTPGTAALSGATIGTWFAPGLGTAIGYGIGMGVAKLWGNDIHEKNIVEDFKDSFTGLGMLMKRLVYSKLRHFNPAFADKLDTQFGNFSDVDAANLRANLQELQFMLTLLLTYLVAKAVLFDDDEDKKNQLVHNYLINQIVKVQGDLMFYTSPQTPGTLMEQLIPVSKLVNQSFGLINSANKAIYNVELQPNEDTFGENFGELFPSPIPSTKVFERVFNEPSLLKKLYE